MAKGRQLSCKIKALLKSNRGNHMLQVGHTIMAYLGDNENKKVWAVL